MHIFMSLQSVQPKYDEPDLCYPISLPWHALDHQVDIYQEPEIQ